MTKFKIGDEVCKKNPQWGEDDSFTVRCIHEGDFRWGRGSELRYSSSFYEFGYLESQLSHFERSFDRDGAIQLRPVERLTSWIKIKSKFVQWRYKLKWGNK